MIVYLVAWHWRTATGSYHSSLPQHQRSYGDLITAVVDFSLDSKLDEQQIDMADWQALAVIHILVGFEADLLGLVPFKSDDSKSVRGLLITAFLFYTVVALLVALQKFADLKLPEKIVNIICIILLFLAGQNRRHAHSRFISA